MGNSLWSSSHYEAKALLRAASGAPVFDYHAKVESGAVEKKVHEKLDPAKMNAGKRECRDSVSAPNATPVFVGLDVTGSMSSVPGIIQKNLPKLMGLLVRKGYLPDPAICIAGIGDAKFDSMPLQIGQFESGIEIENDITNLYLEGGGGGNMYESYELAIYFLAYCTACDAFEKRNRKGYAFIVCDEELASSVMASEVNRIFGGTANIQEDIPIEEVLKNASDRWEIYCVIPKLTSHFDDPSYSKRWRNLLGERVLMLDDPAGVSELIATTVGILEGNADYHTIIGDLTSEGTSANAAESVSRALANVDTSRGLSKIVGAGTGLASL